MTIYASVGYFKSSALYKTEPLPQGPCWCASGLVGYLQRDWKTLLTGGLCPSRSERGARLVPFVGYLLPRRTDVR